MEFKYIVFFVVLVLGVPAGVVLCSVKKEFKYLFLLLMMLSTAMPQRLGINFFSHEFYRAATRGIEVSLIDICALVLFFHMLLNPREYRFRWFPPLTIPYLIYILIGFVSWALAGPDFSVPDAAGEVVPYDTFEVTLYPVFELSKILRGCFVYLVVVNLMRTERDLRMFVNGLALLVLYMTYESVTQRYLHGINRVAATLGHPNSLATYMAMCGTLMFAFMLSRKDLWKSLWYGLMTGFSGICVILSISRGGLAAMALGLWLDFVTIFRRHFNIKNLLLLFLSAMAVLVVIAMAADTLLGRFVKRQDAGADLEYRGLYNQEARLMAEDRFFGVGLGNFSAWSWRKYAAEVSPSLTPGTPAHNLWYVTLGETGYLGMWALVLIWLRYYQIGLRYLFGKGKTFMYTLATAAVATTLISHLQNALQLGYRQTPIYFMLRMLMGVTIAIWYIEKENKAAQVPNPRVVNE